MGNLRVGIIGLGMMGRHHARVVRETSGVELVAVADPFGDVHGVAGPLTALENVDQLIATGIDMAVCAVPTAQHEDVGIALAEAGVHTLIEKPIAHSAEAGERLLEAFTSRGLVGAVGHVERYNPALQSLRARLANGDLGEVYQVATRRQGPFPSRIADVGVVKDLATHDIDLTMWLARSPYAELDAQITTRSGREHEDMIAATGRLANGVITNHLVNWLSPMKERVTVVTGEKGAFVADTLTADLTFHGNGVVDTQWDSVANFRGVSEGDVTRFAIPKPEPLRTEHESFRDAVLGAGSGIVTLAEGLETLRTAEWLIVSGTPTHPEVPA
ncbi:Gfo/Idh/MocA family protein [Pseudonocardia parietis]|uniref:Dehydrogenase n=1 Tax=Pseudonocardia parietis TaxID=570936 RepID=A0ABS4VL95_9PSEU|nr:Gfo/Idh/MocA family oxidoreductase [Pseudonocardia parietis]MBP2364683.1 putative dehydrogenase [Pseudonocardia parietis]